MGGRQSTKSTKGNGREEGKKEGSREGGKGSKVECKKKGRRKKEKKRETQKERKKWKEETEKTKGRIVPPPSALRPFSPLSLNFPRVPRGRLFDF
jgi:hypothetical protein